MLGGLILAVTGNARNPIVVVNNFVSWVFAVMQIQADGGVART